ncbi:hypothetical protein [Nonomuraea jiangxiensis]|uniref:M6 family metalloprotease domain-containing protein n=1 Tax=Nonomuraea jiangxiensis TaxID=633440 RepID=A0A1G9TKQ2_9ACTN|nr:hypothetical protein [Nonomuraea jiangxiensis]SDM48243.1 M6 family metalloprotease domain-containing protein [Nonomuraea jiangxiensis]
MISRTSPLPSPVITGLAFDEPGNAVWFATGDGHIGTWRLLGEVHTDLGTGWPDAIAVLPGVDGVSVRMVTAGGQVYVAARGRADRADAELSATHSTGLRAAAGLDDGTLLLLDGDGAVVRLRAGAFELLVDAPAGAATTAMCVDPPADELLLATPSDGGGGASLERRSLQDGTLLGTVPVPHPVVSIVAFGGGALTVDDAGTIRHLSWASGEGAGEAALPTPVTGPVARWHSLVFAASGAGITVVDWGSDTDTLAIEASLQPLAAGGWAPMTVDYDSLGIAAGDVDWIWEDAADEECVSIARPGTEGAERYEHRVLAGPVPGERTLVAIERASGKVLATRRFRVLGRWPDDEAGPPQVISGEREVYAKPGWGGGPGSPQNIRVHPAPEEYRIAVAVFRCKGSTAAINAAGAADQRRDELTRHVVSTSGDSVDRWFREVSYADTPAAASGPKGTRIRLLTDSVIGPIDVPYTFAELFSPGNAADPWGSWDPKPDTWDVLGGTFSTFVRDTPLVIGGGVTRPVMEFADAVVFTILPGTDELVTVGATTTGAQWTWAYAGDAQVYWKPRDGSTTFTRKPAVVMPAAISAGHATPWAEREYVTTIVHELGHTLGMPDLYQGPGYPGEIGERYVGDWDIMHSDVPLPHLSLPHRMRLGWIDPSWVEVCDFSKNPATREITLQALETLARTGPAAGKKAGIEIRLRDGWNYYFEHRREQTGQIGDQNLPKNAVLGTDVFQATADDMARPLILLLPNDVDGDGPVLSAAATDYEESDVTNPDRMNDFRLTRLASGPFDPTNDVRVRVEYVGAHRAELQITPARGNGHWKSPDIDIDGPSGPNIVVKGHKHRIRIRVRNAGSKAADKVTIRVGWLPFTTTPGTWQTIPSPTPLNIAAKSSATFEVDWMVPASVTVPATSGPAIEAEHFCVRVDIDRYVDPVDPTGSEIVIHNNWAQSNFNTASTAQSSPSSRETTAIISANPFPTRALQRHVVEQTGDQFRLFLDEGWRIVDAGATGTTRLAYESFAGDPRRGAQYAELFEGSQGERITSEVSVRTFVLPEGRHDSGLPGFGAGLWVRAGWRTRFEDLDVNREIVFGTIVYEHDGTRDPVPFGEVRVVAHPQDRPDETRWLNGGVTDGRFRVGIPRELLERATAEPWVFEAFYFSTYRHAPTRSGVRPLRW